MRAATMATMATMATIATMATMASADYMAGMGAVGTAFTDTAAGIISETLSTNRLKACSLKPSMTWAGARAADARAADARARAAGARAGAITTMTVQNKQEKVGKEKQTETTSNQAQPRAPTWLATARTRPRPPFCLRSKLSPPHSMLLPPRVSTSSASRVAQKMCWLARWIPGSTTSMRTSTIWCRISLSNQTSFGSSSELMPAGSTSRRSCSLRPRPSLHSPRPCRRCWENILGACLALT